MYPLYKKEEKDFELYSREAGDIRPSLHASLEIVYVQEGAVGFGTGGHVFTLQAGDLGIVFPNQIHQYERTADGGSVVFILAAPALAGSFLHVLENSVPEIPVIRKENVHQDILHILQMLISGQDRGRYESVLHEAYMRVILSRILPFLSLIEKGAGETELVDRVVSYIAAHYMEPVTLTDMARDLYVSPFSLSRIFSQAFGMNFNRYLNLTRLEFCRHLLEDTDKTVTEICLDAGFGSQRTFDRVFREEYGMSPARYRKNGGQK